MRRRLNLLVLAVTSLVMISFTVPLGALVARQADASARREAERLAESVAATTVRITVGEGLQALSGNPPDLPDGIGLVFPSGAASGTVTPDALELAAVAAAQQQAVSSYTSHGWALALPVLTRDGTVVVTAAVAEDELRRGVVRAWGLLALLGVGLVGVAMLLAGRLGSTLTRSVAILGEAAQALAAGDLRTRVTVVDPPELRSVAEAFNDMAPRLEALIAAEREEVADLSHRLRTPLARLRLQIERVGDETVRGELSDNLDRLERAVDDVIHEARRRPERSPTGVADLGAFLTDRAAFWTVLAEEQDRRFEVVIELPPGTVVGVGNAELTAAMDAVLGNVFDHTPEGTAFALRAQGSDGVAVVTVEDAGDGYPSDVDVLARGTSAAGSTGLGLDIALRAAERAGGAIRLGRGRFGGASVELVLPVVSRRT